MSLLRLQMCSLCQQMCSLRQQITRLHMKIVVLSDITIQPPQIEVDEFRQLLTRMIRGGVSIQETRISSLQGSLSKSRIPLRTPESEAGRSILKPPPERNVVLPSPINVSRPEREDGRTPSKSLTPKKTDASIDLNPSLPYTDCDGQDEQQKNHGAGKEKNERRGDRHRTESESSFRRDGRWESLKVTFLLDQTESEPRFRRDESRKGASLHDRTGSESSFRTSPESVFRREKRHERTGSSSRRREQNERRKDTHRTESKSDFRRDGRREDDRKWEESLKAVMLLNGFSVRSSSHSNTKNNSSENERSSLRNVRSVGLFETNGEPSSELQH
ncbi:pre-mRNA-splicing factor 38B-like [Culex quinquefasciatus]|uniref:pre-mRNA-splicing factor 38B-like n=1 Tax=Culex quinquefasciatus TaxID=7176 RepID=UPI0018E2E7DF|nr:pre-mRNA-splicing factor 38B-like [Culex quinquefasciatus]